jgi:hypothetical protein
VSDTNVSDIETDETSVSASEETGVSLALRENCAGSSPSHPAPKHSGLEASMFANARPTLVWIAFLLAPLIAGCASREPAPLQAEPEYVPPRLELARFGALGLVEFSGAEAGVAATAAFLAAVHAAQPGTPVLELGACAGGRLDPAAIRELAARERVDAIWVGAVTEVLHKPRLALSAELGVASASARRKASLTVRLFDGASGATLWSASSERTLPVMSVDGSLRGLSNLHTTPAEEARALLVRDLVDDVTLDLRGQWVSR